MSNAGIDLGGHVVHVGISNGDRLCASAHLSVDKEHSPDSLAELVERLASYLVAHNVEHVIVEKPLVFAGQGFPILDMAEMLAVVKLAANEVHSRVTLVTPAHWRKNVLHNGRANKKDAIAHCKSKNWITKDHNEAESLCIALYEG